MKDLQEFVGNLMAIILFFIVVVSLLLTLFSFLFRDGRHAGAYGSRGNFYMSD